MEGARRAGVAIASHPSADPDSVSSAISISTLLEQASGSRPCVMLGGGLNRPGKKIFAMAEEAGVLSRCPEPAGPGEQILVLLDAPSCSRASIDCTGFSKIFVLDHHESSGGGGGFEGVIEPSASSTAELCTMMMEELGARPPSSRVANMILAGILYDTRSLQLASLAAVEATRYLMIHGAGVQEALKILRDEIPVDEKIARLKALRRARFYRLGDRFVCITSVGAYEASAAQLLTASGCDMAVVISRGEELTRVVARCSEDLCGSRGLGWYLFDELTASLGGSWGGHALAAVASLGAGPGDLVGAIVEILSRRFGAPLEELG